MFSVYCIHMVVLLLLSPSLSLKSTRSPFGKLLVYSLEEDGDHSRKTGIHINEGAINRIVPGWLNFE